jgi:hypothetical protein
MQDGIEATCVDGESDTVYEFCAKSVVLEEVEAHHPIKMHSK